MKIASDVNIIFAYSDENHIYHKKTIFYLARIKRFHHILLAKVKAHFIYTYTNYLTTGCVIIDHAVREHRKERANSPSTTYKPSPLAISANIDKLIQDYINLEASKKGNFNSKGVRNFINLLLTDYSIPELYESNDKLGEFREKYLIQAEQRALETLNKFLSFFQNFDLVNIEKYNNFEIWINNIKNSKKDIKIKHDLEDILVVAEYLSFNEEIEKLGFFTCDKECYNSIKLIAKEHNLTIGRVDLISY